MRVCTRWFGRVVVGLRWLVAVWCGCACAARDAPWRLCLPRCAVCGHTTPLSRARAAYHACVPPPSASQPAHNGLGLMYMEGHGVEANASKAVEHFTLAIEAGVVPAHNNLGIMYINVRVHAACGACLACPTPLLRGCGAVLTAHGCGPAPLPWPHTSYQRMRTAHLHGHARIRGLCSQGEGVPRNTSAARHHFQQAADLGFAAAMLNMAMMELYGWDGPANCTAALKYLRVRRRGRCAARRACWACVQVPCCHVG